MSGNKGIVERYAACFSRQDWAGLASLLTDDVVRLEVGAPAPTRGKQAVGREMAPPPDVVRLQMDITRAFEEGDAVVAEGTVRVDKKDGSSLHVRYCTIFDFDRGKILRITAYTALVPEPS